METMKYSDTAFPVHLDPGQIVAELHANAVDLPKRTVREHIEYALDHPIGAGPIEKAVQAGDKAADRGGARLPGGRGPLPPHPVH